MRKRVAGILLCVLILFVGSIICVNIYEKSNEQKVAASTDQTQVIPGGMAIGIYMETDGVLVVGTEKVEGIDGKESEPAAYIIKKGDYIIGINDTIIKDKKQLIHSLQNIQKEEVVLKVKRNGEILDLKIKAVKCENEQYKLGIWVRDNTQGLGTITYIKPEGSYGALGHGIYDLDTGELMEISQGDLYLTRISGIQKGKSGNPGGMQGVIIYSEENCVGTVDKNTKNGIFGTIQQSSLKEYGTETVKIAKRNEVKEGSAMIRCALEEEVEEYEIEITAIHKKWKEKNKELEIEVVDKELLYKTGGIVQGMSGSPIIQDGKIIGAVTHVFVNDPTRGYGIFIEEMLEE